MNRSWKHVAALTGMIVASQFSAALAEGPAEGSEAPNFKLPVLDHDPPEQFELSELKGTKPVVLIFGSYT